MKYKDKDGQKRFRKRSCLIKTRFPSKEDAEASIWFYKAGDTLHSYHCKFCKKWHVGHNR